MYMKDFDIMAGEAIESPEIIWEEEDRWAIIAFLLLSAEERINAAGLEKLDAFIASFATETENKDCEENENVEKLRALKETIVQEGNKFLDNLNNDEDRYDCILDELDCIIEGNDKCSIGNGYTLLGRSRQTKLTGAAYWLFDYLKLVAFDTDYNGNKKRLLKHLARKWDINKTILPVLEKCVKSLDEISRERNAVENSDIPHRQAALDGLNAQEKAIWKELNKMHIAKERSVSAYVTSHNNIIDAMEKLTGVRTYECKIRDEDDPVEDEDDYEESLSDKIGDFIEEGIHKVGDLICAPFEWMTDKIMEWT